VTPAPLHLAGERLMLDPAGILAWPARRLLVVADLHLEKGSAFAARGAGLVPPYDTRETLRRLLLVIRRWRPERLIALGDSFHDRGGASRLSAEDAWALRRMLDGLEMVWVRGNHDPDPPAGLPGLSVAEWREAALFFLHQARPGRPGQGIEVSGHFHPKATMPTRCGGVTRPCFVTDGKRLILPAFGAFTGGLDAADPALAALLPRGGRAFLLGRDRLFTLPLRPQRPRPAAIRTATPE
jgi:hypothetical protein